MFLFATIIVNTVTESKEASVELVATWLKDATTFYLF